MAWSKEKLINENGGELCIKERKRTQKEGITSEENNMTLKSVKWLEEKK